MGRSSKDLSNAAARRVARTALLACTIAAGLGASTGWAQEGQVINAMAFWRGGGFITQSGEAQRTFVGAMSGELYVDTDKGPVHAGQVTCPGTVAIDTATANQEGSGSCAFTATDGAQSFGDWTCTGVHLVGCRGEMRLTGGTGRLAGITGTGKVTFRADFQGETTSAGQIADDSAFGIVIWRDLTISLPPAAEPAPN